jgi:hypothetical protein
MLLSPFVAPPIIQLNKGDYELTLETSNSNEDNSGDLISYFIPDTTLACWQGWSFLTKFAQWAENFNKSIFGNILEKSVYPGWISLVAIGIAFLISDLRKRAWPWLTLALSFWVISLGPTLFINGKPYLRGFMPFRLFEILPVFSIIRAPSRFAFLIPLGAGIILGLTMLQIKKKCNIIIYNFSSIFIIFFILFNYLPLPTQLTPNTIYKSTLYDQIRMDKHQYSILNIPVDFKGASGGGDIYVYAQTIHQKPIVGGYVSREPKYALRTLEESPFLLKMTLADYAGNQPLNVSKLGHQEMLETLEQLNVGYIILHKTLLNREHLLFLSQWIEKELGRQIFFEDDWIYAYKLR